MISYQTEMNRGFAGYYSETPAEAKPEPKIETCPCCKQPVPATVVEREWTVEEILAREG